MPHNYHFVKDFVTSHGSLHWYCRGYRVIVDIEGNEFQIFDNEYKEIARRFFYILFHASGL